MTPPISAPAFLIACLCAQWYGTGRDDRAVPGAVAVEDFPARLGRAWAMGGA